jgi:hypothetical protein
MLNMHQQEKRENSTFKGGIRIFVLYQPSSYVRPYSHGTTQKKLKGYASHQTVAWETPPM